MLARYEYGYSTCKFVRITSSLANIRMWTAIEALQYPFLVMKTSYLALPAIYSD